MDDRRGRTEQQPRSGGQLRRGWRWQSIVAALLALLAVEGQPMSAMDARFGQVAVARAATAQPATIEQRAPSTSPSVAGATGAAGALAAESRPDLSVAFARLDEAQAGRPFSFALQLRNAGGAAGAASVSVALPTALTNVRVTAPGFACTRRFAASGPQAGTLVSCARNDLERDGVAEVQIEANAPSGAGELQLTASADPRDDIAELDETNNEAAATVQVRA